ncbi:MAG: ABC transporter permease [bacterium]|jgi:simple sugar transport system permease protein|nr:ABC transporter permease [bacterium]
MTDLFFTDLPMILHAGCITAAPLLWATLGGAFSERSGVVNIGLEGMMLIGAFAGVAASGATGNPWLGLLAGALAGGLFGLLHALICLWGKADQIVSGMGLNLMAYGMTGVLLYRVFETRGNSPEVPKIPAIQGIPDMPFFSPLLFPFSPLHLLLLVLLGGTMVLFYKTRFGLRLRACGENPHVVRSAGIRVDAYRYTAVSVSGTLAGLGGVQLALGDVSQFSVGMTNGRGFLALAILICSGWRPGRAAILCVFFGSTVALADRLQSLFPGIPSRALLALPFVLALLVLAFRKQTSRPPQALGM